VKAGVFSSIYKPPVAPSSLILSMDAGNPSSYPGSGTAWLDLSGHNNHGTMMNSVVYNSVKGGVMDFTGTAPNVPRVDVADQPELSLSTGGSVALWTYIRGTGEAAFVAHGYYTGAQGGWMLWWEQQMLRLYIAKTPHINVSLTRNVWQHIVCTWSGTSSGMHVFINGVDVNSNSTPTLPGLTVDPLYIGTYAFNAYPFDGQINDVQVHNKPLSAAEVTALFTATRARYGI